MQKFVPFFIFILSLCFLIPGVTLPLLTIKAFINKQEMMGLATQSMFPPGQSNNFVQNMLQSVLQQIKLEGSVEVFESTRSLIGTMNELISNDHIVVGLLIGIFGLIIPVVKIILILLSALITPVKAKKQLLKISGLLSKWAMSDVFMMAIMVAFLAINANEQSIEAMQMTAVLGPGFYFFSTYCILSIVANQMLEKRVLLEDTE